MLTCLRHIFVLIPNCSFIFDSYSINLCLGSQLFIICHLIPLYFSKNLHRHSGIFLPNVWTLPSESCLPFCLVQEYSYLCGQGGDVTLFYPNSFIHSFISYPEERRFSQKLLSAVELLCILLCANFGIQAFIFHHTSEPRFLYVEKGHLVIRSSSFSIRASFSLC